MSDGDKTGGLPPQGRTLKLTQPSKKVSVVSAEDMRRFAEAARSATRKHPFPSIKEVEDGNLRIAKRPDELGDS